MDDSLDTDFAGISPFMIAAVEVRAEFIASLLGETISKSFTPEELKRGSFHPAQLLELGAAIQLRYWEENGIDLHVEYGLPTYAQALEIIESQEVNGASGFEKKREELLSYQVMRFWLERFSWVSQEEWGTDIIVGSVDEDAFVRLIAEFLSENVEQLQQLQDGADDPKDD